MKDSSMKPNLMAGDEPEMPTEAAGEMAAGNSEQCVPTEALAMPDSDEQMTAPEVGDPVSYTVEGKVTRVDGKNTYVKAETINGKPVEQEAQSEEPMADGQGEDAAGLQQLQDEAGKTGYMG